MLGLATYGGRINTVAPDATASAQRAAILDIACNTGWLDPADAAKNLTWARAFYRALFEDTGGVPVPGDAYEGAFINHPDVDLADPALNTSGVPWHPLYRSSSTTRLWILNPPTIDRSIHPIGPARLLRRPRQAPASTGTPAWTTHHGAPTKNPTTACRESQRS